MGLTLGSSFSAVDPFAIVPLNTTCLPAKASSYAGDHISIRSSDFAQESISQTVQTVLVLRDRVTDSVADRSHASEWLSCVVQVNVHFLVLTAPLLAENASLM